MRYEIKNEWLTVQADTFGGQLTSVKDCNGIEYLWQGDAAYWSGQAPILFPIVGSLRNKTAQIGGKKSCLMERHGVVRKKEFTFLNQTPTAMTFSITPDDEMKKRYPYNFELQVCYILKNNTVTTQFTVFNHDETSMPYFIGGHPGFRCPLYSGEQFEDYIVEFPTAETAHCPTPVPATGLIDVEKRTDMLYNETRLPMQHALFKVDAVIFDQLQSRSAKLYNPKTGKGILMDFADFDYFLVWSSANDGPFVALEPWSGLSTCSDEDDIFEHKRGVKTIQPHAAQKISFAITVLN